MPNPIDPELMAKLQAAGWLDPKGTPAPGGAGALPAVPQVAAAPNMPAFNAGAPPPEVGSREAAIQARLTSPVTPMKLENPDAPAPRARGVFEEPEGGAPKQTETSGWTPPRPVATGPKSVSVVSPTIRAEYDAALNKLKDAPEREAGAQAAADEQMAAGYENRAQQMGDLMLKQDAARKDRQAKLDALGADYKRLQDEAANDKIEPGRWFASKDTASQVLGILGMMFSGWGKGPNQGVAMFERMQNADIEAQKHDIAQKGKKAEALHTLYGQKLKQFGDEDAADLATRAQMNEQFKLLAMAEALRTGSSVKIAQAQTLGAQMDLKNAQIHQSLEKFVTGGSTGGITPQDQQRAFDLIKSGAVNPNTGAPLTPNEAIQMAMSLRGAAPSPGHGIQKPGSGAGGKADKHDIAASELEQSGKTPIESLGAWDMLMAGAAQAPVVGPLFRGTEGAAKSRAIEGSNLAPLGYAHAGVGIRNFRDMQHAADPILIKPTDSQKVINQKLAQRILLGKEMKQGIDTARRHPGGSGREEKDEDDE